MISLGGGIESLGKGKRFLIISMGVVTPSVWQSLYFPRGLKKLFIATSVCVMEHKMARALG